MGTSTSRKGPSPQSPLVPPWADADPAKPLPTPEGQRFRGFRTEFGHAAAGAGGSLAKALGKYARDATGGSGVGPRRFGPAYSSGAGLAQLLGELGDGGTGEVATGVNLANLAGSALDFAAQEIAKALAPDNADADQIAAAIQEAMVEVLVDQATFDPTVITPDQIVALLVEFFARILFQEISGVAGDAWKKCPNVQRTTATENELLELVRTAMDKHLSPRISVGLSNLSKAEVAALERAALEDVWREWEEND